MKALSIRQPYAAAILAGIKRIEYRTWATAHRGLLLIHAGRVLSAEAGFDSSLGDTTKLPRGALVGIANLLDCRREETAMEEGVEIEYDWHFGAPLVPFRVPLTLEGRLRLFTVPDLVMPGLLAQLEPEQRRQLAAIDETLADRDLGSGHEAR